jgi:hypothetical protein
LFEKAKKIFSKKTTHLKKTSKVENLEKKFKNLSGNANGATRKEPITVVTMFQKKFKKSGIKK